jgi:hypothetical protein
MAFSTAAWRSRWEQSSRRGAGAEVAQLRWPQAEALRFEMMLHFSHR